MSVYSHLNVRHIHSHAHTRLSKQAFGSRQCIYTCIAQLISALTKNVIAYAASVLLWFQARDSLTERAEQGGCLKVMFSQIPRYHAHTLTDSHMYTHILKGSKTLCL